MTLSTEYPINSRIYQAYLSKQEEPILSLDKNYLFDLSYLGILNAQGERANEFLQGQVTADLREINVNTMRTAALCNLKGRVLTLMDIIDRQDMLQLIMPRDLLDKTKLSLEKPAMLSRVRLQHNDTLRVFGLYHNNQHDVSFCQLPDKNQAVITDGSYCCYQISPHYYIVLCEALHADTLITLFQKTHQYRGSSLWHTLMLQQGRIEIYPNSSGLFLPHRLDLQHTNILNFQKGCYKGQEIIARTHYRATLKHKMTLFTITTHEPLHSGQRLLHPETGAEIGELVDFCLITPDQYLIAASVVFETPAFCLFEGHTTAVSLA